MEMVLGLRGLPAAEVSLVRSIVRLSSMLDANWAVSDAEDGDLLLVDGPAAASTATAVVPVVRAGDPAPEPALRRPIRAEALVALLNAEAARRNAALAAGGPPPGDTAAGADPQPVVQAPRPEAGAASATARLKRWPSWNLLKDDRAYLRMATMMSSASLSVERLGELSGARPDVCHAFIRHMDEHQMLVWTHPAPVAQVPAANRMAAPDSHTRSAGGGFLNSLRRKLGIARLA